MPKNGSPNSRVSLLLRRVLNAFLFSKKLQVESRQLLDVRRSCFQQLMWVFPTPLERSDVSKYFAIHFIGAFCGGDIVWHRILRQFPPVVYSTGVYPNSISASYSLFHAPNTTAVVTLPEQQTFLFGYFSIGWAAICQNQRTKT